MRSSEPSSKCKQRAAQGGCCNFSSRSAGRNPPPILSIKCFGLTNIRARQSFCIRLEAHPTGSIIKPSQPVRQIKPSQMGDGLFDSDLSYQDAVENFFAWKKQAIVGSEAINNVNCQILESKPDGSSFTIYAKVRTWIDPQRFVPMRIEKYSSSGELVRRIDVTRVARDERHNPIPANLTVHGSRKNSVTQFNGARIDQDVNFTDADFTPAGLSQVTQP